MSTSTKPPPHHHRHQKRLAIGEGVNQRWGFAATPPRRWTALKTSSLPAETSRVELSPKPHETKGSLQQTDTPRGAKCVGEEEFDRLERGGVFIPMPSTRGTTQKVLSLPTVFTETLHTQTAAAAERTRRRHQRTQPPAYEPQEHGVLNITPKRARRNLVHG